MTGASEIIEASDTASWRDRLAVFERVDVCQLPEYHLAYALRFDGARPLMWCYREDGEQLCYPFLLTPVVIRGADGGEQATGWNDVSGIYGYSGPLSTSADREFLDRAWRRFDAWATSRRVLSEFIRFSAYVDNRALAARAVEVSYNRPVAIAELPGDTDTWFAALDGKTRNMLRKARKAGLVARSVRIREGLADFRRLYATTMSRNRASGFFAYDDAYYEQLLRLPDGELLLAAVDHDGSMVAAAMALVHGGMAFYHLGASEPGASRQAAGNLALFQLAGELITRGIGFFSVGGGRGTAADDPLYRFKRSNANAESGFYIGKRIIDTDGHAEVVKTWETMNHTPLDSPNLQFYR